MTGRPPPQWRAAHHRGGRPTTTLMVSCHHRSGGLLATSGRQTYDQKLTYYHQTDNMCSGTLPPRWCVACHRCWAVCHHSGGRPATTVVGCLPPQWWAACHRSGGRPAASQTVYSALRVMTGIVLHCPVKNKGLLSHLQLLQFQPWVIRPRCEETLRRCSCAGDCWKW